VEDVTKVSNHEGEGWLEEVADSVGHLGECGMGEVPFELEV